MTTNEYRESKNGGSSTCEFCGHDMKETQQDDFWCERCGSSKLLLASGVWESRPGSSDPARYDAEMNAPAGPTEHEKRWAAATNDPNGNY